MVLPALGLQKLSSKSKAKDHRECLSRRLDSQKQGDLQQLLKEIRIFQKRLVSGKKKDYCNPAKKFSDLIFEGKANR